jgi:hypothetical protein
MLSTPRVFARFLWSAMVVALIATACGKNGNKNPGGGPTGPSDSTTPTTGVSVTIGTCTSEPGFCGGNSPSLTILADSRSPQPNGSATGGPPCANCPFSYTFLSHTISGSGRQSTQFLGISEGNYEITGPISSGELYFQFGGTGGFYARSIQVTEGPNPIVPCQPNGGAVARFSQAAGRAPRTIRFIVAVRQGVPECASIPMLNGTYTGSATDGNDPRGGANLRLTFTVADGVISFGLGSDGPVPGTVSATGAIAATGGSCNVTITGQITVTTSGVPTASGTWSHPPIICGASANNGTWIATRQPE